MENGNLESGPGLESCSCNDVTLELTTGCIVEVIEYCTQKNYKLVLLLYTE